MFRLKSIILSTFFTLLSVFFLLNLQTNAQEVSSDNSANFYKTFSKDGAWCWFSDPRAVYLNGKIYSGWVSSDGSIMVASYNEKTGEKKEVNIYPQFNKDDHANPSFVILPDKRIMVFFTAHSLLGLGEKVPAITYATTKYPEDITEWEIQKKITQNSKGPRGFCYTNPIMLSEENNRIYIFWRGGDYKPTFSYTDDFGKTWSKVFSLVKSSKFTSKRPYVKVASNGKDEIHFAFTDGHPRNEPLNSIYYLKYKGGKFYKADGTQIGTMENLPIVHEDCSIVYNSPKEFKKNRFGIRSWIWDIALAEDGNPTIAYTLLPEETKHHYYYAKWDGQAWSNSKISNAGSSFPRYKRVKEYKEPEPHYSGGIYLDHENPNIVYYSKPINDIFEIYKAETKDNGKTWVETAITTNSKKDNVRPYAIRGANNYASSQVLWMFNNHYSKYVDYNSEIKMDIEKEKPSFSLTKNAVKDVLQRVADWQVNEELKHSLGGWTNGALFAGMVEWAKMADDSSYFEYLEDKGNQLRWARKMRTNPYSRYNADDYATGQMFVEMFRIYGNEKMIKPTERYFNFILAHPSKRSLNFIRKETSDPHERWSWCDALFMAPTVWAKMANELNRKDYLNFMHEEYLATYNYLYDKVEHLFYRDDNYFTKVEANGKKIFWGRGNGWVIGGLPTILEEVPSNWEGKIFYETLFKEMATKIASLQDGDGYWHASLLDPESYPNPETSSSAFFTYALAWGINNGYLSKEEFQSVVNKGWEALVKAVYPDGKLGWVQPIGHDPKKVTEEMTEVYGVGAFLLAGTEIFKMIK
ncbi:MAG: glycoside hydrolase family 88 protein [Melioribacteraceae bacterium]